MEFRKNEALMILRPFMQKLDECVRTAFEALITEVGPYFEKYTPMSLGITMSAYVNYYAKRFFASQSRVRLFEEYNSLYFIFDNAVVAKFKKMDEELHYAPPNSERSKLFLSQQLQLVPETVNVNIAYVIDQMYSRVQDLAYVCPNGHNDYHWRYFFSEDYSTMEMFPQDRDEKPEPRVRMRNPHAKES